MASHPSDDDDPQTPGLRRDRCGRYRLERLLATGGMGDVYLGIPDDAPERRVVVKKVRLDHVGRRDVLKLFQREIELNVRLDHPNIVKVLEVGEDADGPFMVLEYLRGHDLAVVLRELEARGRSIPFATAAYIVRQVLHALAYAHGSSHEDGQPLGIVHRDISPSNVFLTEDGAVKLLDFGIAKLDQSTPTTLGAAPKGKGAYMAPEQCRNQAVDARTDLFALGAVLYEATTMQRAFPGDNLMATLTAVLSGETVRPRALVDDYPDALERVVLRALRTPLDERFQTAEEMGRALDEVIARERWAAAAADVQHLLTGLYDPAPTGEPRRTRRLGHADVTTNFDAWKTESATPPVERARSRSRPALLAGVLLGGALTATWWFGGAGSWFARQDAPLRAAVVARPLPKPRWAAPASGVAQSAFVRGPTAEATPCRSYRARLLAARGDRRAWAEVAASPIPTEPGPGEDATDCASLEQLLRSARKRGVTKPSEQVSSDVASPGDTPPPPPAEATDMPARGRKISERLDELRAPAL